MRESRYDGGGPRCATGEDEDEAEAEAEAVGPMTSSTMRPRSTALATRSGSTRLLFSPGGGQTASRKIEPDSERMPSRCGGEGFGLGLGLGLGLR